MLRRLRLAIQNNLQWRWRIPSGPPSEHLHTSYQTRIFGTPAQRWFFADGLAANASDTVVVQFLSIYAIALGAVQRRQPSSRQVARRKSASLRNAVRATAIEPCDDPHDVPSPDSVTSPTR